MCGFADDVGLLFAQRTQLVKGVEGHELNAGFLIQRLAATLLRHPCHHAVGTAVTVSDRQTDPLTLFIKQYVIHTPGINADTVKRNTGSIEAIQPLKDVFFQRVEIPGVVTVTSPASPGRWKRRGQ